MRAIVLQLTFLLAIPMITIYPHVGVYMYYWFTWLNPHRVVWGLLNLDWGKIIALMTIIFIFLSREEKKYPLSAISIFTVIFFVWTSFTTFVAKYPDHAFQAYTDWLKVFVMMSVTTILIRDRLRLHGLIWIVCISMAFWGVKSGVFTLITGGNYHVLGPEKSAIFGTNEIARAFMMSIPLMYYLALQSRHKYVRWAMLIVTGLTVMGMIGTTSRTVFAVFALMAVFWWMRSKNKLKLAVVAVLTLSVLFLVLPKERLSGLFEKHQTSTEIEGDSSFQHRVKIWNYIVDELAGKSPIVGGGFKSVLREARMEPHSNYFQVLGEHGYVGLAIYLFLGVTALLQTNRIYNQTKNDPELTWARDLAQMLQLSFIGYFAAGVTKNHAFFEMYYMQLAMVIVLDRIISNTTVKDHLKAPKNLFSAKK